MLGSLNQKMYPYALFIVSQNFVNGLHRSHHGHRKIQTWGVHVYIFFSYCRQSCSVCNPRKTKRTMVIKACPAQLCKLCAQQVKRKDSCNISVNNGQNRCVDHACRKLCLSYIFKRLLHSSIWNAQMLYVVRWDGAWSVLGHPQSHCSLARWLVAQIYERVTWYFLSAGVRYDHDVDSFVFSSGEFLLKKRFCLQIDRNWFFFTTFFSMAVECWTV